jgi:hypothetical protein
VIQSYELWSDVLVGFLLHARAVAVVIIDRGRRIYIVSSAIDSYYRPQVTSTVDCDSIVKSLFPFYLLDHTVRSKR